MKRLVFSILMILASVLFHFTFAETVTITGPGSTTISTGFNVTLNISGAQSSGTKHYSVLVSCPGCTPASWNNSGNVLIIGNGQTSLSTNISGVFTTPAVAGTITLTLEITDANGNANCNTTCTDTDDLLVTAVLPLPVELIDFKAITSGKTVELSWITASETDNEKFQIERSKDGVRFETIGEVSGAGTTIEAHAYTFTDEHPKFGPNYYRLKQMDYDGDFEYSPVEVTTVGGKNRWYLKTANGITTVFFDEALPSSTTSVQVFDNAGKQVWQSEAISEGVNILEIPIFSLSGGQYFVRVITKKGATTQAFFKN